MSVNRDELSEAIAGRIRAGGGFLSFEHFMQAALYEPGLGYYESAHVFGEQGDFVTGADLGPWLALAFADLIAWGWQQLGQPSEWCLLEQGGGSGRLLCKVATVLRERGCPPPRIVAVEASAFMRERQRQVYAEAGLQVEQYAHLAEAKRLSNCLMICNELPDAFPVRCFVWQQGQCFERGVGLVDDRFAWQTAEAPMADPPQIDADIMISWPEGYSSEFNHRLSGWQDDIVGMMDNGYLFCVDYGYAQREYYRPQRIEGTLMGHRGHKVVEDVLQQPGSCDITAHIDFTAMARSGAAKGLQACGYLTQGAWLAQSPMVQAAVQELALRGDAVALQQLAHAKRMMLPTGMGESFKLLVAAKGAAAEAPDYLARFDRLDALRM